LILPALLAHNSYIYYQNVIFKINLLLPLCWNSTAIRHSATIPAVDSFRVAFF